MLIGGLDLKNPLCLAPLAGVTTLPVREFFSYLGAGVTHTEMISCAGLIRDNEKTFDMLKTSEHEAPLVVQLFAPNEKILLGGAEKILSLNLKATTPPASLRVSMAPSAPCEGGEGHEVARGFSLATTPPASLRSATSPYTGEARCKEKKLTSPPFAAFGINMACPMPKITKNFCGAALLKRPETAFNMTKNLKALKKFPVWVKIRKLEKDSDTLNFIELLAKAGADNICIHGRTAAQRYEGQADKKILELAAKNFPGLISASGDVKTLSDIQEYFSFGCVAVMLARGAIANPFLFEEARGVSRDFNERLEILINFAKRAEEISGEHKAIILMKRFAPPMLKFFQGSAEKRNLICTSTSLNEIIKILRGN